MPKKNKKLIPQYSYPPEEYCPKQDRRGHCAICGLPNGRVYPQQHPSQSEKVECVQCGATWYEISGTKPS